ncbi:MAG: helix-turn-helix transcriptional regulator [Gemmatimonadetes bacterium]|nr:helix-turn-helix transcriptional regulator [Gemmatimonadota bacterium]
MTAAAVLLPPRSAPADQFARSAEPFAIASLTVPGGSIDVLDLVCRAPGVPQFRAGLTIGLVHGGTGRLDGRSRTHHLGVDTLFVVPAGAVFAVGGDPFAGLHHTLLHVYGHAASAVIASAGLDSAARLTTRAALDPLLARRLRSILAQRALPASDLCFTLARVAALAAGTTDSADDATASESAVVRETRTYFERHYGSHVNVGALARAHGISVFRLIREFGREVGMPPYAYLRQLRVNQARELIRAGQPLTSTAYQCGFCDQSHLTRAFKRQFGVPPGAYAHLASVTGVRAS